MDAQSQWTGLDATRLDRIADHLQRNYIEPQKIAGCQVQVARHGHIAYEKAFGSMDVERNKPMRDDAIFRIYSMTKPITSVVIMQLFEEGKLRLEHELHRYIPAFKDTQVWESGTWDDYTTKPAERPILIRSFYEGD